MKEAAGEANMTVITIVLIAVVLGIGTIVVTRMMGSMAKKEACSELGGSLTGTTCNYVNSDGTTASCTISKCDGNDSYKCSSGNVDVVACPTDQTP